MEFGEVKGYFSTNTFMTGVGILGGFYLGKVIGDYVSGYATDEKTKKLYKIAGAIVGAVIAYTIGVRSPGSTLFPFMMAVGGALTAYAIYEGIRYFKPDFQIL